MARLPIPGDDKGTWGNVLNDFLNVAHSNDGTLKNIGIVADKYTLPSGGVPESDLSAALQAKINAPPSAPVTSVNGQIGVVNLTQDDLPDGTTNKQYSQTDRTKLTSIQTGATVNSSDATLLNRTNHTGTQAQSTITNLVNDLSNKQPIDGDLTDISALSAVNDDILQRKGGEWTNRTPTQLKLDLNFTRSDIGLGNVTNDAQLKIASNLSDLNNVATARSNLGLDSAATQPSSAFIQSGDVTSIVVLTQAEFDLIFAPNPTTLYVVTD